MEHVKGRLQYMCADVPVLECSQATAVAMLLPALWMSPQALIFATATACQHANVKKRYSTPESSVSVWLLNNLTEMYI